MTPARRELAASAFRELSKVEGQPESAIIDAVRLWNEHVSDEMEPRSCADVIDDFLASCRGNVSNLTIKCDYQPKFRQFAATFGDREIHTLRTAELEAWLNNPKYNSTTRKSYRIRISMLFKYAITHHHAKLNPAKGIRKMSRQQEKKMENVPPAIMDADEFQRLLDAALVFDGGKLLPYFALGGLAGLRPYEARRLSWEDIRMDEKELYVPAEASKTGDDREVPMPDSLIKWLEMIPLFQRKGRLPWSRHAFDQVRTVARVKDRWREPKGSDILRHSAASHHYRLHENNLALTAAVMGHDIAVFKNHYKARVRTTEEARAYFNVSPNVETIQFESHKTA